MCERIAGERRRRERFFLRRRRHRADLRWVSLEIEEVRGHLHAADAVGQGMVQLHDERGPVAFHALDERELPQRAFTVESGHAGLARIVEDVREPARRGHRDVPGVESELEVVVDDPAWVRESHRRLHDLVPEPRSDTTRTLGAIEEALHVRTPVEHHDTDDRRSQQRVGLHVPRERISVSHVLIAGLHLRHLRSILRWCRSCARRARADLPLGPAPDVTVEAVVREVLGHQHLAAGEARRRAARSCAVTTFESGQPDRE